MTSEKEGYSSGRDDGSTVPGGFVSAAIKPQQRALYDSNVTLEEYMYYAEKARAEEDALAATAPPSTWIEYILPSKSASRRIEGVQPTANDVKTSSPAEGDHENHRLEITDLEWTNASRALRSASAAACFYLITTDILGPFGVGFSIGTMGWGQGIGLFTIFGLCAGL
jgi:hypothetical protein